MWEASPDADNQGQETFPTKYSRCPALYTTIQRAGTQEDLTL